MHRAAKSMREPQQPQRLAPSLTGGFLEQPECRREICEKNVGLDGPLEWLCTASFELEDRNNAGSERRRCAPKRPPSCVAHRAAPEPDLHRGGCQRPEGADQLRPKLGQ